MMSACVAMNAGETIPAYIIAVTGSGFTSRTTLAVAVYCFGSRRLTVSVTATVSNSISAAIRQRARTTDRI